MPLRPTGRALIAIATILAVGPALAEGGPGHAAGFRHRASARSLPPEVRYRDPRYLPPPRRAPRLVEPYPGPPAALIEAYLPRFTNAPMYNEPPSRFPQR